jgi:prevent-host-death family protein
MHEVSIQEAQSRLADLIHRLAPGDELVITENGEPVARLVPKADVPKRKARHPGTLTGTVLYMAPDFNAPLDDLKDYME